MRDQPDIALIVLDTQRRDRLGCYGCGRATSPNLDAFARNAVLFENAISPAQWTIPVHASWFSGEPPSAHMVVQSGDALDRRFQTLAERLRAAGYQTVGFCNNPLVGVIDNGFRRGFETFYNYSGAVRSLPRAARRLPPALHRLREGLRRTVHQVTDPIQNAVATSNRVFQAMLNPLWVPLWTHLAHFKGDTRRSVADATQFVRGHAAERERAPYFMMLNVMETHLPFSPPQRFVQERVPYLKEERAAQDFMSSFNTQAGRWLVPLEKPFSPLAARTMSDMYDAEVAYQDHLLGDLLALLDQAPDTLTIVVSDHGEMLGEGGMMGHAFGVSEELIHVPLLIRFPGAAVGRRFPDLVSTTRLFHTVLEQAGMQSYETAHGFKGDAGALSLARLQGDEAAFSEAYPPEFALRIMARRSPAQIDALHLQATNWAAYDLPYKLVRVGGVSEALSTLPGLAPCTGPDTDACARQLGAQLDSYIDVAVGRRLASTRQQAAGLDDQVVRERLRGLGYIE